MRCLDRETWKLGIYYTRLCYKSFSTHKRRTDGIHTCSANPVYLSSTRSKTKRILEWCNTLVFCPSRCTKASKISMYKYQFSKLILWNRIWDTTLKDCLPTPPPNQYFCLSYNCDNWEVHRSSCKENASDTSLFVLKAKHGVNVIRSSNIQIGSLPKE